MIAKGKSIAHGAAAIEYDLNKKLEGKSAATEIQRHELFGCTGEEIVQEMKPYFSDFPNVKNNCLRFEVSPSVEESAGMTDADWMKLGNDFLQRMGLMNLTAHSGTEYKASEIGKGYTLAHIEKTQNKLKYNPKNISYGNELKSKDGGLHI